MRLLAPGEYPPAPAGLGIQLADERVVIEPAYNPRLLKPLQGVMQDFVPSLFVGIGLTGVMPVAPAHAGKGRIGIDAVANLVLTAGQKVEAIQRLEGAALEQLRKLAQHPDSGTIAHVGVAAVCLPADCGTAIELVIDARFS